MFDGFVRLCAATPALEVANVEKNAAEIARLALEAAAQGANVCVFPELCLTGYTLRRPVFARPPRARGAGGAESRAGQDAGSGHAHRRRPSRGRRQLPVQLRGGIAGRSCAGRGTQDGTCPTTPSFTNCASSPPPSRGGARFIGSARKCPSPPICSLPAGNCRNLSWAWRSAKTSGRPCPPASSSPSPGRRCWSTPRPATPLAGKRDYRRELVSSQSARLAAAYVYAGAGPDESTQDVVFAGHSLIYEYGSKLAESEPFYEGLLFADADVGFLALERRANNDFREGAGGACGTISFSPAAARA